MYCSKISLQPLLKCFDNDLENNIHNAEKLQEILNTIMKGIVSKITLKVHCAMQLSLMFRWHPLNNKS